MYSVMTPAERVVSVQVDAGYKDIATLLGEHGVSAAPVLDADGHVVGVVSEEDLLAKESRVESGEPGRHENPFAGRAKRRVLHKAAGITASELMTKPPVTIGAHEDVVQAARMMVDRHVKRLVVTDARGGLRGVISRRDVLKVFARSDEAIRSEIVEDVVRGTFWINPATMDIRVEDGVVRLRGHMETWGEAEAICGMVRRTDGVVAVVNEISYDHDDSRPEARKTGPFGIFRR
ncbi:CBS domain-containing protein [Catenulispora subtropica]|uniref:CBS domain-containing protein n=1 Tax=Catenulispora subtropica TaxID=450798 RepID=A0ABP5CZR0_9ACTN